MKAQTALLSQLHSQLLNFGLNPSEWSVRHLQTQDFVIENRKDQRFQFRGKLVFKAQRPTWKSLELFSI